MKSFTKLVILLILSLPYFLGSCTKDEFNTEGVSAALPSFLSNYANTENTSAVKIKADLSNPVKDAWIKEDIKFGHHTSVLIENEFIYTPLEDGIAKVNRKNGTIIWSLDLDELSRGNMAIDGNIIYASADEIFYAIDKNSGSILWSKDLQHPIFTAPLIVGNNVLINDTYGIVYAFDKTAGDVRWWYEITSGTYGSAMVRNENKVFIASSNGEIHCLDINSGKKIWVFDQTCTSSSCPIINTPLIVSGSNILFGNVSGNVFSVNFDGSLAWQYKHSSRIYFKGAALSNNNLVLTGTDGNKGERTICVDINSKSLLWQYDNGSQNKISLPMIANDRFVLIGSSKGLNNIDILTGKLIWNKSIKMASGYVKNQCLSNIAITDLDIVYTTSDGKLVRFVY
ncbi:MAG TPA: PQQ-binding-like beta-propeller repeat protein [Saprospiraceae bacterium]|jgi:outer membrane protein assembly factor BamB|nr:PQQ-binding-like beta-propeller repeat protein [Saprospiraceae bacterium]